MRFLGTPSSRICQYSWTLETIRTFYTINLDILVKFLHRFVKVWLTFGVQPLLSKSSWKIFEMVFQDLRTEEKTYRKHEFWFLQSGLYFVARAPIALQSWVCLLKSVSMQPSSSHMSSSHYHFCNVLVVRCVWFFSACRPDLLFIFSLHFLRESLYFAC